MWTQIRSHIKGSIEAAIHGGGILPKAMYMDESKFNRERCRLEPAQREEAYEMYLRYRELQERFGWWDDCDRAASILMRSGMLKACGAVSGGNREPIRSLYDRVYVDEVRRSCVFYCIALYCIALLPS